MLMDIDLTMHPALIEISQPPSGMTDFPIASKFSTSTFMERPDWLVEPVGEDRPKLKVLPDGTAAGYFVQWGECILDGSDECWSAGPSPSGYELFHQGSVETTDGDWVDVGVIGGVGGHADPLSSVRGAVGYYSDISKQLLVGRCHEDGYGAWFQGHVLPHRFSDPMRALLNRSSLSGDWRWVPTRTASGQVRSDYDCLGPWLVTRPAFPLRRGDRIPSARVAAVPGVERPPIFTFPGGAAMPTSKVASASEACSCKERCGICGGVPPARTAATEMDPMGAPEVDVAEIEVVEGVDPNAPDAPASEDLLDRLSGLESAFAEFRAEVESALAVIMDQSMGSPVDVEEG